MADDFFDVDADDIDRGAPAGRDRAEAGEGPWDSDVGRDSDRDSDSDSDIWGTVDGGSDAETSDAEDSDSHDRAEFSGADDRETSTSETRGQAGRDRDRPKGRRRRRRRGGRDRAADSTASEDLGDELPVGERDEPASQEASHRGELDSLDDSDDDSDVDHHSHRGIPSWGDAIGFIIDANMEGRARSPKSGGAAGRRGGRGRSSGPRRGRDDDRS